MNNLCTSLECLMAICGLLLFVFLVWLPGKIEIDNREKTTSSTASDRFAEMEKKFSKQKVTTVDNREIYHRELNSFCKKTSDQ